MNVQDSEWLCKLLRRRKEELKEALVGKVQDNPQPTDYIWMAIYLSSQAGFILCPEDSGPI